MSMYQENEARELLHDDDEVIEETPPRASMRFGRGAIAVAAVLGLVGAASLAVFHSGTSSSAFLKRASPPVISMVKTEASRKAVFDTKGADPCDGLPYLKLTEVTHNNLGNKGPDEGEEGIFYKGEDSIAGTPIIVHIHAKSDYFPNKASENGFNGRYASVNLKGGTQVDLEVELLDEHNEPKTLKTVDFTFFDLDTGKDGETTEFLKIKPYSKIIEESHSQLEEKHLGYGSSEFTATKEGDGEDNPDDPSVLTHQQMDRAVTVEFKDFQKMEVTIGSTEGHLPRWFLFVARPSLLCAKLNGKEVDDGSHVVEHGPDDPSVTKPATTVKPCTTPSPPKKTTTTKEAEKEAEIGELNQDKKQEMCCFVGSLLCGAQKWWPWC